MHKEQIRCGWVSRDPLYISYHDEEWGVPVYDSHALFELLVLEGMQAGLSWITILKRRNGYRDCFDHFDPAIIATYDADKIETLMLNPAIIRHRLKIESVVNNANAFLRIPNFSEYMWSFVDGTPIKNNWERSEQIPASTPLSEQMSKDLKKRGFKFVGPTICYAFMQAAGMVDDHLSTCFKRH